MKQFVSSGISSVIKACMDLICVLLPVHCSRSCQAQGLPCCLCLDLLATPNLPTPLHSHFLHSWPGDRESWRLFVLYLPTVLILDPEGVFAPKFSFPLFNGKSKLKKNVGEQCLGSQRVE